MAEIEINIEDKVKLLALDLGIEYNDLKPKTKQHLINVESAISNRESKYKELKEELQNNKINLSSITEDIGISRQTIYNNPELKYYINTRIHTANELNPYYIIDDLKSKIDDLKQQLNLMYDRDIDTEILRYQVKKLKTDVLNREETIARMEEQATNMKSDIRKLKKVASDNSNPKSTTKQGKLLTLGEK